MTNQILVIAKSPADAKVLKDVLGNARDRPFEIEWKTGRQRSTRPVIVGRTKALI